MNWAEHDFELISLEEESCRMSLPAEATSCQTRVELRDVSSHTGAGVSYDGRCDTHAKDKVSAITVLYSDTSSYANVYAWAQITCYHQSDVRMIGRSKIKDGWWAGCLDADIAGHKVTIKRYDGDPRLQGAVGVFVLDHLDCPYSCSWQWSHDIEILSQLG